MVYVINDEQLTRRKLVTIDGSKVTTETNIPLGLNINLPGVKAAGADVRLAKLDGTPIAREIECKDVPTTDDIMIWYPWNTTSGQDDQFWVYWGNQNLTEPAAGSTYGSEAVWDSSHTARYGMNIEPYGAGTNGILDSTSNNNNGTPNGFTSNSIINGDYGKGINFDGSSYINITGIVDTGTTQTIFMRIKPDLSSANHYPLDIQTGRLVFDLFYSASQLSLYDGTVWRTSTGSVSTGTLYNINYVLDGGASELSTYVDGVKSGNTVAYTPRQIGGTVNICANIANADIFDGIMEEMRIYSDKMSANYMSTTHNNFNNPTATGTSPFYKTFGLEQHQRRTPQFIG